MKQSLILLVIRVLGLCISLISLVYVTSKMELITYSLLGITNMYNSMFLLVPNIGIDSYISRNYLVWNTSSQRKYRDKLFTYSIICKLIIGGLLGIILIFTSYYYIDSMFGGNKLYINILFIAICCSLVNSITNSLELGILSSGDFVYVNVIKFIFISLLKFILLFFYNKIGAINYVICVQILFIFPLIFFIYYIHTRKLYHFNYSQLKLKHLFDRIWPFTVDNYLRYFGSSLDQFVLSFFVSSSLFATYSLIKNIESQCRVLVDALLDPMTQNMVQIKLDPNLYTLKYTKIRKFWIILIFGVFLSVIVFFFCGNSLLLLVDVTKYPYIYRSLCLLGCAMVIYVTSKLFLDYIALFSHPINRLLVNSVPLISLITLIFIGNTGWFVLGRIFFYLLVLIVVLLISRRYEFFKETKNLYFDI